MAVESQGLHLEQKQRLRLSQQQLRFVRLLELTAPELDEAVERELEDNPALEAHENQNQETVDIILPRQNRYYNTDHGNNDGEIPIADNSENLYDYLIRQVAEHNVAPDVLSMAEYLIGNIDSNGYLRRPLSLIINDIAVETGEEVSAELAQKAFNLIRTLDPPGIGATDLRDTLRLQLLRMSESEVRDDALRIINDAFEEFTMKHYHRFRSLFKFDDRRIKNAVDLILSLNPKPGAAFASRDNDLANIIIPDFIVENRDGNLFISLNNHIPELSIEESFSEAVDNLNRNAEGKKKSKGSEFILQRYNDARDFIRILRQRQKTMMMVMTAITELQKDYFLTEDVAKMKPMMIKDISARTGLDISTVSRATNNKFVATGWGILPMRHFFSDNIGDNNDIITNRRVEAEIEKLIEQEDKRRPLSDDKICKALKDAGYEISRRTIAKYRDRLNIPVARLRRSL